MSLARSTTSIRVVDLAPEQEALYFVCLEDWPGAEIADAGDHKARWYQWARQHGLRVKLAIDADGEVGGMIQYLPIEHAPAVGKDLHFILCVWVHAHRQGRGDRRGHGLGTALLEAAETDARALGSKGMAAWGLSLPIWMRAAWFRRHGYRRADRRELAALVWKPFSADAVAPRWLEETDRRPDLVPGKVTVTGCLSGWCPAQNLAFERARRAAAVHGARVEVRRVDTSDRATMEAWGQSDALFVDQERVRTGPPPSQARLVRLVGRHVARLKGGAGAPWPWIPNG
jgi:N-acetylglutamate synthase-like GNAT family acetyltransferase